MNHNKLPFVIILLFILFYSNGAVSEPDTKAITIEECIKIALQNHSDIKVAAEDKKIHISDYKIAKAKRNISISAQLITEEYDDSSSSESEIASTSFQITAGLIASYSIIDVYMRRVEEASRLAINLAKIEEQQAKNTIMLGVKKAYYAYLLARENVIIHNQLLIKYKDKLNLAKKLYRSGSKPILDVSKAEVTYAEASLSYQRALNDENSAKIELYSSMGLNESNANIYPKDIEKLPQIKYSYDDLYKLSKLYYPGIQTLKVQKELSKKKIAIEKALRFPRVKFNLLFGYENTHVYENDSFSNPFDSANWEQKIAPTIVAQMPLYLGGEINAKVEKAISNYNKVIYKEREVLNKLQNQIRIYYRTLEVLLKQIEMAELVIQNANKHLLLASKSYEIGKGSLLNLHDAQASVLKADLQFLNVKYNYLLTIAQMSNIVGLGEDRICKK